MQVSNVFKKKVGFANVLWGQKYFWCILVGNTECQETFCLLTLTELKAFSISLLYHIRLPNPGLHVSYGCSLTSVGSILHICVSFYTHLVQRLQLEIFGIFWKLWDFHRNLKYSSVGLANVWLHGMSFYCLSHHWVNEKANRLFFHCSSRVDWLLQTLVHSKMKPGRILSHSVLI